MKEFDKKIIQELYDNIYREDFLQLDESKIDSFDWDRFFYSDYMGFKSDFLLEDFQKVTDNSPTIEGNEDVYVITLRSGKKFNLIINYVSPEKTEDKIKRKSIEANSKNDTGLSNCYKEYFSNLGSNEYIGIMQFRDEQDRLNLTGDVGYTAQELFKTLKEAIFDSFYQSGRIKDLRGFMMRVVSTESKRMVLYQKMVERFLSNDFPNIFIDDKTEPGILLLVVTK
jgi:hypothetical protein